MHNKEILTVTLNPEHFEVVALHYARTVILIIIDMLVTPTLLASVLYGTWCAFKLDP